MSSLREHRTAILFLSAGRCGTQWLAKILNDRWGDLAVCVHEPPEADYRPGSMLRANAALETLPGGDSLRRHIERIQGILRKRDYIETGWRSSAALPWLRQALGGRLRVVHLTRHPVHSACSMTTLSDDPTAAPPSGLLTPSDSGVQLRDYAQRWARMSVYERCLFHWAELNLFAIELYRSLDPRPPWFHARIEALSNPRTGAFRELVAFLGLPERDLPDEAFGERVDAWRRRTPLPIDWSLVHRHPAVTELANRLGYAFDELRNEEIQRRYRRLDGAQRPFDVAVVIPTTLEPVLKRAIASVFAQDLDGRVQVLIGIDKAQGDRSLLEDLLRAKPANCEITVVDLGYSTSQIHGGLHSARDGGALRTILSFAANSRYVAYLDDDNWWAEDHLRSLLAAIDGKAWAYSLRWLVDEPTMKPLVVDRWHSVGPGRGDFKDEVGGLCDPSTLLIDKLQCEAGLHHWCSGLDFRHSADKRFFRYLAPLPSAGTDRATASYVIRRTNVLWRRLGEAGVVPG